MRGVCDQRAQSAAVELQERSSELPVDGSTPPRPEDAVLCLSELRLGPPQATAVVLLYPASRQGLPEQLYLAFWLLSVFPTEE